MTPEMMALIAIAVEQRGGYPNQVQAVATAFLDLLSLQDMPNAGDVARILDQSLNAYGLFRRPDQGTPSLPSATLPAPANSDDFFLMPLVWTAVENRGGMPHQVTPVLTTLKSSLASNRGVPLTSLDKTILSNYLDSALIAQGLFRKP